MCAPHTEGMPPSLSTAIIAWYLSLPLPNRLLQKSPKSSLTRCLVCGYEHGAKANNDEQIETFLHLAEIPNPTVFKASTNESSLRHRPVTTKDRNCTEDSDFPPSVRICRQPKGKPSHWQTLSLSFSSAATLFSAQHLTTSESADNSNVDHPPGSTDETKVTQTFVLTSYRSPIGEPNSRDTEGRYSPRMMHPSRRGGKQVENCNRFSHNALSHNINDSLSRFRALASALPSVSGEVVNENSFSFRSHRQIPANFLPGGTVAL